MRPNDEDTIGNVRFIVTDYDHTAAIPDSTRDDLLSTSLIQRALDAKQNYQGFYGCTHRSLMTAFVIKYPWLNPVVKKYFNHHSAAEIQNITTTKITQNFYQATNLPCQAVSMLDDVLSGQCGATYNQIIKPYEASQRTLPFGSIFSSLATLATNYGSKNPQLLQIAQHAAAAYPNVTVTIDFFDDKLNLCQKAVDATKQMNWPKNVNLNVFHHGVKGNIQQVTAPAQQSFIRRVGFFAVAAVTVVSTVVVRSNYSRANSPA